MSARRIRALIGKELRQIVRDPSSILIALVLPLILLFLFGYGVSLDSPRTTIDVVLESSTPDARDLAASFVASPYFRARIVRDRREAADDLVCGAAEGFVVIPGSFDSDMRRRSAPAAVQLIVDGTAPNTAALVRGYAQGVIATWTQLRATDAGQHAAPAPINERYWFNSERLSRYVLVPGSVAIVMALVGTLLTALVVAREWERGTMEAMFATPVSAIELLIGKFVPYFLLGLASMSLCAFLSVALFGVPFRGSVLALVAIAAAFLLPSLGQGFLISSATKNQFLASQLALLSSFLPTFLLSGFLFEINSMPVPLQWLTHIVAARWLIPCLETVFLAGDIWPLFLTNIAILCGFGVVLLALAARATRKRIA